MDAIATSRLGAADGPRADRGKVESAPDRAPTPGIEIPGEMHGNLRYADTFAGLSPDEMGMLAETKRFIECYLGDRGIRAAVAAGGKFSPEQRRMLKEIGINFPPEAMAPLWKRPGLIESIPLLVARHAGFEEIPSDLRELLAAHPEFRTWFRWRFNLDRTRVKYRLLTAFRPTSSAQFTAWRSRRVETTRNELGAYGWRLEHPCHAMEMAVGCSVGCGFCAFDAGKLETVFDFSRPENRELVRSVASGMLQVLGWPAASGMLYWSTEPHDNPHYLQLLKFWEELTGAMLCTTTARTGEDWIRSLIDYYAAGAVPRLQISVLTRPIMRRLHKTFTPLELRDVSFGMQQKDADVFRVKVPSGRKEMLERLIETKDLRDVDFENPPRGFEPPQTSVACVSGFLINMVKRSIKLISPCHTTLERSHGYRTFDETTFDGPEDFEPALRRVIGRSMVEQAYPEMPVRWRDDLKVVPQPDGFTLLSPTTRRDFRKGELHLRAADLIGRGDLTHGQVFDALADHPGIGPLTAMSMLDLLFAKGYLCELAITRDYRARREAGAAAPPRPAAAA